MMGPDTPDPDYPGAIYHCNINVSDLNASNRFYRDVLGLDHIIYLEPDKPQEMANGNLGDAMMLPDGSQYTGTDMDFKAVFLGIRSDSRTPVDLVQWKVPGYGGRPYEAANNIGIVRVAIEVDRPRRRSCQAQEPDREFPQRHRDVGHGRVRRPQGRDLP